MPVKPPESQSGASTFDPGQESPAWKYGVWGDSDVGAGVIGASNTPMTDTAHVRPAGVVGVNRAAQGVGVEGFCARGTGVLGVGGADQPGVAGRASTGPGVTGVSAQGVGVTGVSGGTSPGVLGRSDSGPGAAGESGSGPGLQGTSTSGTGVLGRATDGAGVSGTASGGPGVQGTSARGAGVLGQGAGTSAGVAGQGVSGPGVSGTSTQSVGVFGQASGTSAGVSGQADAGPGVSGTSDQGPGLSGTSAHGAGVSGQSGGTAPGVSGTSAGGVGVSGTGGPGAAGVTATGGAGAPGVFGRSDDRAGVFGMSSNGPGVSGATDTGAGVHGSASDGTGVNGDSEFQVGIVAAGGTTGLTATGGHLGADITGGLRVNGVMVAAGSAQFVIDHPLLPAENTLAHAFVASPERKNVYDGVVALDDSGAATVTLPDWFDALNQDFRYQLTSLGAPAPGLHVSAEIAGNSFSLAGGPPAGRVSWQVTGVRLDSWAQANPLTPVAAKPPDQQDFFLHPTVFDQPIERGIGVPPVPARQDDLPEEA